MSKSSPSNDAILTHLIALYGDEIGRFAFQKLKHLIEEYRPQIPPRNVHISERDAILITYGDQIYEPNTLPLQTLAYFCEKYLKDIVSSIHILPFYPYSSDDGFSVIDYQAVNPTMGNWNDIARIGKNFRLMFDAVINHISAQSAWFQKFLQDDSQYRDYFIVVPDDIDLSRVVRPRTSPLLTPFITPSGTKNVWTTFSADQADLNYHNPVVLLEMTATILSYVSHRAEFIRLDAIAFLWKEFSTPCIHLPQTHRVIQFWRAVLDVLAPHVQLITETNVPHVDNISYWGNGSNEAQLVYNFALPPLVLHTFYSGQAQTLSTWAKTLSLPSNHVTFFNFLASHDGIGLNPARGILTEDEIDQLVERAQIHGGLVSYKSNADGSALPYEININFFDALSAPDTGESQDVQIDRFMTAQAIMLALVGVPGIYFHSLFGSRGWRAGIQITGQNRAINREKFYCATLEQELSTPNSRQHQVWVRYAHLLRVRTAHPAFHPHGTQQVLQCGEAIFAILRTAPDGSEQILCLHNVSNQIQKIVLDCTLNFQVEQTHDLITEKQNRVLYLNPYQTMWLVQ